MNDTRVNDAQPTDTLRANWLTLLQQHRAIAIVRAASVSQGVSMAKAAAAAGFRLIEVAWTNNVQPAQ
ncbi:MAG: hypothetical protein AAGJ80_16570, partial [Cyanobacteria bacterium J06553_1]